MYIKVRNWYLLMIMAVGTSLAMDTDNKKYEGNTTASGELISVETLPAIAKQYKMPRKDYQALQTWFNQKAEGYVDATGKTGFTYGDLITKLARAMNPLAEYKEIAADNRGIMSYFEQHNIKAYRSSSYNYVLEPIPGYRLIIAGPGNRLNTTIASQDCGDVWCDPYSNRWQEIIEKNPEALEALTPVATQHITAMFANYLLLTKFVQQLDNAHVRVIPTYLVHIPGRPKVLEDSNYVVVEEKMPEGLADFDAASSQNLVSQEALTDLFNANKVGFWEDAYPIKIDKNGNFVLPAPEQPNNSDVRAFFNKRMPQNQTVWGDIRGAQAWARYIVMGIEKISKILKKANPQTLQFWKELIKTHPNWVEDYSSSQQKNMNSLAAD